MKRVCFFNTSQSWGGGERWVRDTALMARRAGYEVHVVTNTHSALADRLEKHDTIRPHRCTIANLSFLNPFTLASFVRYFKKNRISTVILSLPTDAKVGGIAARLAGVESIIYRRGIALPVHDTGLNRLLFRSVLTHFICNSQETRRLALRDNPDLIPPERVTVIPNGLDREQLIDRHAAPLYAGRGEDAVIGHAGRLTEQKGQHLLLEAVHLLGERGHNVTLLVAGEGELMDSLLAHADQLGLGERVRFLGFVESMESFYNSIDFLAHPALWEGFGYVIAESMARGKPVVAFDLSSNPELIRDGQTGLLARPGDVADFADKLEAMIVDPALRRDMGERGKQHIREGFTLEVAFEKLAPLIR
ncbi:glycosyltransferase [Pseudodesulfovibrio pelocollis]|uniref:glycosyltransferase n=1 Tax=Pseudodesulfovibrio pelocollis TaxID=3051432 RepID=UPI00255AA14F|nr:glycosyltransferase [Pseudodesulfovibrio sp. SB368]